LPLVMGVDSSTQATKVEVREADSGELLASGAASHPPTTPPRSEQHPEQWWTALVDAIGMARNRLSAGDRAGIAAIAVAAQQHGMVALDRHLGVIRPAKLWNDTESAPDAARLVEDLGGGGRGRRAWAEACGSVPTAAFTVTKLAWLRRSEPDAFGALAHVLLPHDWLTARLAGELVTDRGDASGTGYWSPATGRWRTDLLARVDRNRPWDEMLPRVLGPSDPAGHLVPASASELGLDDRVVVAAGTGDNMAAALGLGSPPAVVFSIGTSGTVYTVSDRPAADPSGAVAGFADATGRFLPLVCTLNATKVTDAFARLLGVDHPTLSELALTAPAGAGGVVLVPYLDGERTPNRPEATGSLVGLRSHVSPAQVARAAFEGVVCGLLDGLDALSAAGVPTSPQRAILVGGGARSPAYRRVLADLSQRTVEVPADDEQVAMGACVQAAAALAGRSPAEVASQWARPPAAVVDPGPAVDAAAVRGAYAAASGGQSR